MWNQKQKKLEVGKILKIIVHYYYNNMYRIKSQTLTTKLSL